MVFFLEVLTTRVEKKEVKDLEFIEKTEKSDRAVVVRKLLSRAIKEWKTDFALNELRNHKISLRKAASLAGVSYIEMLDLSSKKNIDIGYSLKDLEEDFKKL
ncbi:MAG TPA: UPF0175 family protein [archaeon]|nr:UPF0175 family protein [archaeon]